MKTENVLLMKSARESLKGEWGLAVGGSAVFVVVSMAVSMIPILGSFASIIIAGPLTLGVTIFFLNLSRKQEVKLEYVFKGFNRFATALATYLLIALYVILWALLFIIPGIIAAYSYSMTYYILVDNSSIGAQEAIRRSKKMMAGNKMELLFLQVRFIGWAFLCLLTLGIGFLWLVPYVRVSTAKFYDDIKRDQNPEETTTPASTSSVEADLKNVLESEK